jgi:SpoVK/Ycf46/Vps4 family AAA+-type ATPase
MIIDIKTVNKSELPYGPMESHKNNKFLYKIDRIEGPTIEDLAVWCHNFAIGALSRQLGQRYVVSSFKKKEIEEQKENLLPDFDKILPNPLIAPVPRAQVQQKPEETQLVVEEVEDESQKIVDEIQKDMEEWI